MKRSRQQGFTTVELMATLIVAALFIVSGYQLYGMVTDRSSRAREQSEASSVAYEVLRSEGTYVAVSEGCPATNDETVSREIDTLPNLEITLSRCRPANSQENLLRVSATVEYGNTTPRQKVTHAIYVIN